MTDAATLQDYAAAYAGAGFRPLLIRQNAKVPTARDWPTTAPGNPDDARALFAHHAGNIGLTFSPELFAMDLDRKNGNDGVAELDALAAAYGGLPPTLTQRTPSGGEHRIYRKPTNVVLRNRTGVLPGVDIRAQGAQIVAEPSTVDGGRYAWQGWDVQDGAVPQIADAPEWLLQHLVEAATAQALAVDGDGFTEGSRNDSLFRLAASLRGKGLTVEAIDAALQIENRAKCAPPLSEAEVHTIAESTRRYAEGQEGMQEADTINRLAALSAIEYDRARKAEAEALGIRPATLDKLVIQARKDNDGGGLDFDDIEPWAHPVNPAELLHEVSATVRRFIVCQPETADAVALWAAMTWFMDVVQIAPLAVITAPEKRCGKSQLLFLLGKLSYRPLTASNITPAALFRSIDAWKPTLLVDEADAFMRENEELRGLLNCGHTRDSAYIIRTVGEDFTPTQFNVWGAKALAGIGHLADTLMDRAVTLELRRKLPHEEVDRVRYAEPGLFDDLAAKLARFAEDHRDTVRRSRPELPPSLNDRAQDNWEPLLAIAEAAGGDWPDLARKAALKLSGIDSPTMGIGTELLADIQEVFEHKRLSRISTADLIATLCDDDEKVWATYNRGQAVNPRQIAKRLGDFGIKSKNVRIGNDVVKGFDLEQFREA